jgi:hypothetical protein
MCYDIHTGFNEDWFTHSKVTKGGFTDTNRDRIILFSFVENKDSRLKDDNIETTEQYVCKVWNGLSFHVNPINVVRLVAES